MSRTDSEQQSNNGAENLFLQDIYLITSKIVGHACAGLGHYPSQTGLDDYVHEIIELLIKDDRQVLRSFDHRSKPQAWLYIIARRHILRRLQKQSRVESLENMPTDSSTFVVPPDQEGKLLANERIGILRATFGKLTEHERKLLILWLQERSRDEIAKEMGIKKESVSREINAVIKKFQRIVEEGYGI